MGKETDEVTKQRIAERREQRRIRRIKQRTVNLVRAEKMHTARMAELGKHLDSYSLLPSTLFIGCSGWFYWKWRGQFYPIDVPTSEWFKHYTEHFDTVEINASFYSWPTVENVKSWLLQPGEKDFVYTVKVCELITHINKFEGTHTLVKDFGLIADILGDRMGCFLFQMPPSYFYSEQRLYSILDQLDHGRRNVVEFRHASWWNVAVYTAFRKHGTIFCSCSGPGLPDELISTADEVYLRLHGPQRWYHHNYSELELIRWADRIRNSGAKRALVYFNNDYEAFAPQNAQTMRQLLENTEAN